MDTSIDEKNKLKLIFIPTVLLGMGFIALYTILNWLLFVKLDLFHLQEMITDFGLPAFLMVIVIMIWLPRRTNLLVKKSTSSKYTYEFLAWILLLFPLVISQQYMRSATGELTKLVRLDDIENHKKTKFYTVQNYYVSKKDGIPHIVLEEISSLSRYTKRELELTIYMVFPIYESAAHPFGHIPAWLGIRYSERFSSGLSEVELNTKIKDFLLDSHKDMNARNLNAFGCLDRIGNSANLDGYKEAIAKKGYGDGIVVVPVSEPYSERNGSKLFWLCVTLILGPITWFLKLIASELDQKKLQHFLKKKSFVEGNEGMTLISFFIPKQNCFVTPLLMCVNVIIFSAMSLSGAGFKFLNPEYLFAWGAASAPAIAEGEYWRLLTSSFVHSKIFLLVLNMWALYFAGLCLESVFGRWKFLLIYLLMAVFASAIGIYWYPDALITGADGAIFGLFGIILAFLMPKNLPSFVRETFLTKMVIYLIACLLLTFNLANLCVLANGVIFGMWLDRDKQAALKFMDFVKAE